MLLRRKECIAAGLDPDVVRRLAHRLEKAALDAKALGLTVFGGSHGSLRFASTGDGLGPLICAHMEGSWSGGDEKHEFDEGFLMRGKTR